MLLGDQLNSTKSQNPTSTGERAGDNSNNLWSPILSSYWNLIQLKETQVNWEKIYGLLRQQINRLILLRRANRYQWSRYKAPCCLLNQMATTRWELEHRSVQGGIEPLRIKSQQALNFEMTCNLLSCFLPDSGIVIDNWTIYNSNRMKGEYMEKVELDRKGDM